MTNTIGMKLTLIPPGEFMMGTEETVAELLRAFPGTAETDVADARPQHRVRITKPFYLGTHEVSLGQFLSFYHAANYKCEAETNGKGEQGYDPKANHPDGWFFQAKRFVPWSWGFEGYNNSHPVVNVSWNDAVAFCKWLSKKEGKTYRLPTEAEWEYAARAGKATRYYYGDDPEGLVVYENVADGDAKAAFTEWTTIQARDGFRFTAPCGCYRHNPFGLYDMLGNVEEWCSDRYAINTYEISETDDPTGPETDVSGKPLTPHVIRGGSWNAGPIRCARAISQF